MQHRRRCNSLWCQLSFRVGIKTSCVVAAVPNPYLAFYHYLFSACVWCKRFADNNITDTHTTTSRWEREALRMALMSLRGFPTALQSWFEQHSAFCLQPFSLLLKWCWNSFGEEIKCKKCTTAMLRWETGLTDIDSNVVYMKVFCTNASVTKAMQWVMTPPSAGHVSVSHVREDVASPTRTGRRYHSFHSLFFICTQRELQPQRFGCTNTRRWKSSMKSLYSQSVLWFHFLQESYRLKYLSNVMQWG